MDLRFLGRFSWVLCLPVLAGGTGEPDSAPASASFEYNFSAVVRDRESGAPVRGAMVSIVNPNSFRVLAEGLETDDEGRLVATVDILPDEVANGSFWVSPAYPNPVLSDHGNVTVRYATLGDAGEPPALELYDVVGRPVGPGGYVAAGAYFYRLRFAGGLVTRSQRLTVPAGRRLSFDLIADAGWDLLTAGEQIQGVGQLRTDALFIVRAEDYSTREFVERLRWRHDQTVSISLASPVLNDRAGPASRHRAEVLSPDGRTSVQVTILDSDPETNCLFYRVLRDGTPLVRDSRLGLVLPDAAPIGCGLEISSHSSSPRHDVWHPPYGQQNEILDRHEMLSLGLVETAGHGRMLGLEVKAYNEGVAFRYVLNRDARPLSSRISGEKTEIRLPAGAVAYTQFGIEEPYEPTPVHSLSRRSQQPLTVDFTDGRYAVLAEADNENYPLMWLEPSRPADGLLQVLLQGTVDIPSHPFKTPWRVIVIGDRPGDLIENSTLIENLAEPVQIRDLDWIRPGKAIRANATTEAGRLAVDVAVRRRMEYILFDAGWYGDQWSEASNATMPIPGLDVENVVAYGAERGVGVFLYVNRIALDNQLDTILPVYQGWGIRGIKPGFVSVGPQNRTQFLRTLVRRAAEHRLMVNIHDDYRPDGFSRTFPNLLTQEGVRGNEHFPGARHNTILPFSRFVIGPADYTIGYGNEQIGTSFAHQLALAVVFYSPMQVFFWTDSPAAHVDDPAISFWESVPTVWDETRVIDGRIGEYVAIARRSGDDWFVGAITNEMPRSLDLPLDFLEPGAEYEAAIYRDDLASTGSRAPVVIEQAGLEADAILQVEMVGSGGVAVHLRRKDARL